MDRIKIGVLGLNFGGAACDMIANQGGKPYFQLTAVCDFDEWKGERWRDENGAVIYTDYDKMLAEADMEAVVVMTNPNNRAEWIHKALQAGKHVMTTKPFELDPVAAAKVLKEAGDLGLVLQANSPQPVPPAHIRQINEWREKYNLGRSIGYRQDVWVNYREKPDGKWFDDPLLCPAPPMLRLGIYVMNEMVRVMGEPEEVYVMESRIFTERPTSDNTQLSIKFKNGAMGNIFASFCVRDGRPYNQPAIINFENGTITIGIEPADPDKRSLITLAYTPDQESQRNQTPVIERVEYTGGGGEYQWEVLYRSIKGEKIPGLVTADEIVWSVQILNAMARSTRSKQPEKA